jgi:hypothetical protein
MRYLLSVLLAMMASVAFAAGPRVAIITSEFPNPLVQRAADELAADLKRLYDAKVEFGATVVPGPPAHVILLGMPDAHGHLKQLSDPIPKLSEQGHVVLSREYQGRSVLTVAGGSPAATYWAAAELAHQWGVRTMLYGDVDPVAPPEFSVEGFDIVREPLAKARVWQMDFDSPIGAASWSLADQKKLLRQLARMKFNRLVLSTKAETPAAAAASLKPIDISGDTAGRSAFGGAKFFQNPDLADSAGDEARRQAAEELIRGIEKEAKALDMTVAPTRVMGNTPLPAGGTLPLLFVTGADKWLEAALSRQRDTIGISVSAVGDADLAAFIHARGVFDPKFAGGHPVHNLVTPICGEGVSDRVLKAFELAEEATKLILAGDRALGASAPDVVMKHYSSTDPSPEWWSKARDNYLGAMNEMYRANTRAREGGRSYTLYFARRFEFAFEYMNCLEAVRKAGIAKSKGDKETQVAELEKAVESMNGALNAMAAVARSQSDRGIIAVLNDYGYRPLVKELETAEAKP